MYLQV